MIHSTAIVHPEARLAGTVSVGPYTVIDGRVTVGDQCHIGPHVYLTGHTNIGIGNRFHAGCVIGDAPQDLNCREEATRLDIGDHNVFREYVTVHRSNSLEEQTIIGSHNYLMGSSHVGHNSVLRHHIILAPGALIAGHVTIEDRAFVSGHCLVHQFVRIGMLALMQGGSAISKDLPPFTVARSANSICGLNTIGLRRAGLRPEERLELKRLYHLLFRSGRNLKEALDEASHLGVRSRYADCFLQFIASSRRGVCFDRGAATRRA